MKLILLSLLLLLISCGQGALPILVRENGVTHRVPVTPEVFGQVTVEAAEASLMELDDQELELRTVTVGLSLDTRAGERITIQAGKTVDLHFERIE